MTEDKPGTGAFRPTSYRMQEPGEVAAATHAIVEAWLPELHRLAVDAGRSPELIDGYRVLARTLIREALIRADPPSGDERPRGGDRLANASGADDDGACLDRVLARIVAAARGSGLAISQTLEDVSRLAPAALSWLRMSRGPGAPADAGPEILDATEAVVRAVSDVAVRLSHLQEAVMARAEREQWDALAAMTEILSHELSNRLGAAKTASEMLLAPNIDLDQHHIQRAARLVRSSVDEALRSVEDVRSLTATRANAEEPRHRRRIALPGLIRAVVNGFRPAALSAGVELIVDEDAPDCQVDAARLRLILSNLVGNGIKYRNESRERPRVRIDTERLEDGRVKVVVCDNGIGIPPDEIEDVFLYRERGSGTGPVVGNGLGLAITNEAVEQIGGEISVTSEAGRGTAFTLVFRPLDPPAPAS